MCDWKTALKAPGKFPNTPTCWSIYMMGLNLRNMREKGIDYYI